MSQCYSISDVIVTILAVVDCHSHGREEEGRLKQIKFNITGKEPPVKTFS